jgi:L-threonylcarbamoyladenylate synthase
MKTILLTEDNKKEALKEATAVLAAGGIVIYPTETCYGIGVDATNQIAVDKLLQYKTHRQDKAISVAVTDEKMASKYVEVNQTAKNIYNNFLPGPITVVSKGKHKLAQGVESSMGTQAIRIPDYAFVLSVIKKLNKPITATSANASYKKTPYSVNDILKNITEKQKDLIGLIIDAGQLPKQKPSTVVDTTLDNIHIVRQGSLTLKNKKTCNASSLDDTTLLVKSIFKEIKEHIGTRTVVFLLQGDLGAGKTYFTKDVAKMLNIKDIVVSPTYTICREYNGNVCNQLITLHHIDTYRLFKPNEMDELNPIKMFTPPNVIVIEWANKISKYLQPYLEGAVVIQVQIESVSETERVFEYDIEIPQI